MQRVGDYLMYRMAGLLSAYQVPASQDGDIDANEYVCLSTIRNGDVNGDWLVDFDDVDPFIDVLLGHDANPRHIQAADVNDDTTADGEDVPPFVQLLLGL